MGNDILPEQSLARIWGGASVTLPRDHSQTRNMEGRSQGLLPAHIWMLFAKRFYQWGGVLEQGTLCPAAGLGDSEQQEGWAEMTQGNLDKERGWKEGWYGETRGWGCSMDLEGSGVDRAGNWEL